MILADNVFWPSTDNWSMWKGTKPIQMSNVCVHFSKGFCTITALSHQQAAYLVC